VTIIGIVDGEGGDKRLSEATVDTVAEEHYVFEPYEESQLREILDARRAAFHDEAVTDTVIERAAELAATGGGDAGEGIALLHEAGLLAQRRGETTVRPDHVTAVSEDVDALQLCESLAALPVHARYVLEALTRLSAPVDETDPGAVGTVSTDTRIGGGEVERSETEGFRTTRVYEAYESVCADVGDSPRTLRRVQEFLGQLAAQGVTERSAHWGGRAEGNYYTHRLTRRPAIVHSAVECTAEHDDGERLNIP
jgi:cell division control protein 6